MPPGAACPLIIRLASVRSNKDSFDVLPSCLDDMFRDPIIRSSPGGAPASFRRLFLFDKIHHEFFPNKSREIFIKGLQEFSFTEPHAETRTSGECPIYRKFDACLRRQCLMVEDLCGGKIPRKIPWLRFGTCASTKQAGSRSPPQFRDRDPASLVLAHVPKRSQRIFGDLPTAQVFNHQTLLSQALGQFFRCDEHLPDVRVRRG